MAPKSNRKSITKEEYYKLLAYQNIHNQIMILLENLELDCLEITQEIDPKDSFDRYLLGGLTSDLLNNSNPKAVDDVLRLLGLTVEDNKSEIKNKKNVGKVEKKKFKSGSWKGKKSVNVEFDESDEMKKYLMEHSIILNENIPNNVLLFVKQNEKIDNDNENGSFSGDIYSHSKEIRIDGFIIDESGALG